jgi:hypothetical protein
MIFSLPNLITAQFTLLATRPISSSLSNSTNYLTYENVTLGIRIQYPADWHVEALQNGVQFLSPPVKFLPLHNSTNISPITLIPATIAVSRIEPVQNVSLLELAHNFINYLRTRDPIHKHFASPLQMYLVFQPLSYSKSKKRDKRS